MKLQLPLISVLFAALLLLSCDKTETVDDRWQLENEAQFAKISANSDYTKLESKTGAGHIMYKVIEPGEGEKPYFNSTVKVRYTGWYKIDWSINEDSYTDDKGNLIVNKYEFDSTGDIARSLVVQNLIDGFSTALQHMKVGDKWEIWIPWHMAYGASGNSTGTIPGHTTLVFEIELADIVIEK